MPGKQALLEDMKIIALSGYSTKQHLGNIIDRRNGTLTPAERVACGGRIKKPHAQRLSCFFADLERNPCSHVTVLVFVVVYMYPCLCDILMLHMSTLCVCVDRRRF